MQFIQLTSLTYIYYNIYINIFDFASAIKASRTITFNYGIAYCDTIDVILFNYIVLVIPLPVVGHQALKMFRILLDYY